MTDNNHVFNRHKYIDHYATYNVWTIRAPRNFMPECRYQDEVAIIKNIVQMEISGYVFQSQ